MHIENELCHMYGTKWPSDSNFDECMQRSDHFMRFDYFQFFEVPRGFPSSSPELRSTESRNERFWDALGVDIEGGVALIF